MILQPSVRTKYTSGWWKACEQEDSCLLPMQHTVSLLRCHPKSLLTFGAVCNPFGGLGLTGGIVDVGGLYDCLYGVYSGKADASILDKYSEIRRQRYQTVTDPISQDNIRRLYTQDPEKALEDDELLKMVKGLETNVEAQMEFMRSPMALQYDFTQHYKTDSSDGTRHGTTKSGVATHVEQVAAIGTN